jgi:hypothetical protein
VRNVIHRDRSLHPAGRLRHRGRCTLRMLALAVPASLLVLGMTAAGAASASTSRPASAGQALAKAASTPDYKAAVAVVAAYRAAWGQPACVTSTQAGCLTVVNQNGLPGFELGPDGRIVALR